MKLLAPNSSLLAPRSNYNKSQFSEWTIPPRQKADTNITHTIAQQNHHVEELASHRITNIFLVPQERSTTQQERTLYRERPSHSLIVAVSHTTTAVKVAM